MSRIALPSYSMLETYYPTDSDSEKVIKELGGELTQSWVGSNSCVMRMCKAFNSVGKQHEIPASHKGFLTVLGGDGKNYAIRVMDFIHYLHKRYRAPDIVKTRDHMVAASFAGKKGIIAWHIDGWNDARGHFTLWDGSSGLFEGAHHYFDEFGPSTPKGKPHMTKVEFWTC